MKKQILLILLVLGALSAQAATGDTTWVQAHNDKWLDNYNNFDTSVQFPDGTKSYRKVYMIFTLGKYACPGNPQYCGDWDYTIQTFLMGQTDTVELGRLISPYAHTDAPRFSINWKQRYVFDVTDYYPLLKGNNAMRIHYSGYSGGFTANIKFAFVEGTPARNVLKVERLWHGDLEYGNASNPIENKMAAVSETAPANTQSAEMKFTVTGHGMDNSGGCSEFCKKYYKVIVNGTVIEQKDIWRDQCGFNNLYPQTGTWIYNRGNWCPGELVQTNTHLLSGVTASSNYNLDVDFQSYTSSGGASYTVDAALIYYGAFNHSIDASLEDIVSPSNYEGYYRNNPSCGMPVIKVKNNGGTAITSLHIEYGLGGSTMGQYSWQGNIAPLATTEISLPEPPGMRNVSGGTATQTFTARIMHVNGQSDGDADNDEMTTSFVPTAKWPTSVVVNLKTNNSKSGTISETSWAIYDMMDNLVKERKNLNANTTYIDTVVLAPNCYKLIVSDAGCDGLSWWANKAGGTGTLTVKNASSMIGSLSLNGYFSGDFGCGFTQYFTTDWPTGIETVATEPEVAMEVYPNPTEDKLFVNISGVERVNGTICIMDVAGRVVLQQACEKTTQEVNVSKLAAGSYTLLFLSEDAKSNVKLYKQIVIQ